MRSSIDMLIDGIIEKTWKVIREGILEEKSCCAINGEYCATLILSKDDKIYVVDIDNSYLNILYTKDKLFLDILHYATNGEWSFEDNGIEEFKSEIIDQYLETGGCDIFKEVQEWLDDLVKQQLRRR